MDPQIQISGSEGIVHSLSYSFEFLNSQHTVTSQGLSAGTMTVRPSDSRGRISVMARPDFALN